ncbi:MAG: metalloprotease family protein, partial [Candidatus Gallimonas sp.]
MQILFTVGAIVSFGFLIAACNRRFYANFGSRSRTVCYVTGFLGTPVHECSHALFCLLFGHKITEIKLFQTNAEDGTLGYVHHSYNRKNLYQRAGNFFIGIAPVLVISALLFLLYDLLLPEATSEIVALFGGLGLSENAFGFFKGVFRAIGIFFSDVGSWQFWIFLLVGAFPALHMTLSKADV